VSDRYLWDKQGDPDPEVERLEQLLASYAHRPSPLEIPESVPSSVPPRTRWGRSMAWSLAAAVLAVVAIVTWWSSQGSGWRVTSTGGVPHVGERALHGSGRVSLGEWLETDASSSARLEVGRIGVVAVEPNSRLHVVGRQGRVHRLALERGALEAYILAPPRRFVVDTPSATAVDLGCVYDLEVDASGVGMLTVIVGWVSFESHGRESFVPAGARCWTRPGRGPGTPHFTDAAVEMKNALAEVDLAGDHPPGDALARVLASARREDAFTLWHLLVRLEGPERDAVYQRLAALVPPPAGVTHGGIMAGDRAMLDAWWDALGLGRTKDWRRWKGEDPSKRHPG
jgi:hypothetical protein